MGLPLFTHSIATAGSAHTQRSHGASVEDDSSPLTPTSIDESIWPKKKTSLPPFEKCEATRTASIVVVVTGFVISIACVVIAAIYLSLPTPQLVIMFHLTLADYEKVSFAFNLAFTVLSDQLNYIHAVSLRWALYREGRLDFNTNIRLFTSSKYSLPNKRWTNLFSISCLVLCYAALSQLSMEAITTPMDFELYSLNAGALLALGLGLLGQTTISTYCLVVDQNLIPSWSSNPLNTALVTLHLGARHHPGRSMLPVQQIQLGLTTPNKHQTCAARAKLSIRWVLLFTWSLGLIAVLWLPVTWLISRRNPKFSNGIDFWDDRALDDLAFNIHNEILSMPLRFQILFSILLYCGIQGIQTLGLHCAELIINMSRDEAMWRKAAIFPSSRPRGLKWTAGAAFATDPLTSAFLSWQNIILVSSKAFLHWCFGQAFRLAYFPAAIKVSQDSTEFPTNTKTWTYSGDIQIGFRSGPLITYGVSATLLAVFVTYLAWRKPNGPQPASWGHIQTLVDLVDLWEVDENGRFWWGDKGVNDDGTRIAGTSQNPGDLGQIVMNAPYH
jgi:hypothetical protein